MKERPILFSAPMVRAILEGRKTQTRREVKPQPLEISPNGCNIIDVRQSSLAWGFDATYDSDNPKYLGYCPYGKPGDRLWVREHWGYLGSRTSNCEKRHGNFERADLQVFYHADQVRREINMAIEEADLKSPQQHIPDFQGDEFARSEWLSDWWMRKKSIPSIHMPRWASRITLEVVSVRVERLQDISGDDVAAEGCQFAWGDRQTLGTDEEAARRSLFSQLWSSIHKADGPHGWAANPWVWVVEFKRL